MPYQESGKWRGAIRREGKIVARKWFSTKREAARWEKEYREELEQQEMTLGNFVKLYGEYLDYAVLRFSRVTMSEKQTLGRRFVTKTGDRFIEEYSSKDWHDFIQFTAQEKGNNRANRDRKNLGAFFAWLDRVYDYGHNPIKRIGILRHDRKQQYIPSEEDVLRLLSVCDRRDRLFLLCYLHTAARRSEIFRLTWEDINLTSKEIRLGTRKTMGGGLEHEWLPMTDELTEELKWWYRERPFKDNPHVWVIPEGNYAGTPYTFRHKFLKGACRRAGIKPFGFHSLRRYAASIVRGRDK